MLKKWLPFSSFRIKGKKGKHLTSVEHLISVAVVCFLSVLSEILFLTPQDILYYLLKFLLLLFASTSVCGHEIAQTDNKTELRQQAKPCWCKYWLVSIFPALKGGCVFKPFVSIMADFCPRSTDFYILEWRARNHPGQFVLLMLIFFLPICSIRVQCLEEIYLLKTL